MKVYVCLGYFPGISSEAGFLDRQFRKSWRLLYETGLRNSYTTNNDGVRPFVLPGGASIYYI